MNRRSFLFYTIATTVASGLSTQLIFASSKKPEVFTADLSSELTTVGSSKKIKKTIVVRIAESNDPDSFVAFSNKCTHRGCKVSFDPEQSRFECPCHKSKFSLKGEVIEALPPIKSRTIINSQLSINKQLIIIYISIEISQNIIAYTNNWVYIWV